MKKPFTYTEGMMLMAWAAIFNDGVEMKIVQDPIAKQVLEQSQKLQLKVKALVEGFHPQPFEWTGEVWKETD